MVTAIEERLNFECMVSSWSESCWFAYMCVRSNARRAHEIGQVLVKAGNTHIDPKMMCGDCK